MIRQRSLYCLILVVSLLWPGWAERPESAFKNGAKAEATNNYDAAYEDYKFAHDKKPSDPKYMEAFLRMRFYASAKHIQTGQTRRDEGNLQDALSEFRMAATIDPSNFAASQEIRRTLDQIQRKAEEGTRPVKERAQAASLKLAAANAAGPVELDVKMDIPISLHLSTSTDVVYRTIGKVAGINVLIDPEYKPQKVTLDLKDVMLRDALTILALQSRTFWRALSPNTILVTADNGGKRKELEQNVMMTFYLHNAVNPTELQEIAGTLKGILDINRIQTTPEQRSLTLRGTPDQMVLAQKLLDDIDKPKPEVMIEVAVLEVSRTKMRTLGVNPPTSFSASLANTGTTTTTTTSTTSTTTTSSTGSSGSSGGGFTLNQLAALTSNDVMISVPGASLTALMSDSNTKIIQKPQVRAMDSEKATLKIGDRIPIATGTYQSGLTNGLSTQFQYIDIGVNVDITPYVHSNNDVTLKMSLEISSVTGEQTVDGVTEPTIGQRRIEHQARLADGEVNLIGGILEDSDTNSLSGYPWLTKIPILKYLFGQENKERQQNEIIFAITPHIIRGAEVTDDNLRMVDIGTSSTVTYRQRDQAASLPEKPAAPAPPTPTEPTPTPQSSAPPAIHPSR